jgi:hypothetical protein
LSFAATFFDFLPNAGAALLKASSEAGIVGGRCISTAAHDYDD